MLEINPLLSFFQSPSGFLSILSFVQISNYFSICPKPPYPWVFHLSSSKWKLFRNVTWQTLCPSCVHPELLLNFWTDKHLMLITIPICSLIFTLWNGLKICAVCIAYEDVTLVSVQELPVCECFKDSRINNSEGGRICFILQLLGNIWCW